MSITRERESLRREPLYKRGARRNLVLVMRLAEAKRGGTLERLMSEIRRCQLLILDEWGYIPVDKKAHSSYSALLQNPCAWRNSQLRNSMPE
ncbi:ATP-binding protein [Cohnella suwonensis]|uniref:ATP-binding protein n=1 Tax=Cohnella suwonensis TaxID=696072 RepID=A0ABW0M5Q5_9BACL